MEDVVKFSRIHTHCAGIDIGSRDIFVSIDGQTAQSFKTFTADYHKCCEFLVSSGITYVAMEATGVYWMCLHGMLEDYGIKVCLVNPCMTQQVKGRKSDVSDCQWIQHLFSAGLLRESLIPEGLHKELRMLVRERLDIIEMGATYVNKMQKYLELMNIKLGEVISQITGASGLNVIRAILAGERDTQKLLDMCHSTIRKNKAEEVMKSLEGNYNEIYLNMLRENLEMWENHQALIGRIEMQIWKILDRLNSATCDIPVSTPAKPSRHHNPQIEGLHQKMVQLYGGLDLTSIAGINDVTLMRLMSEIGTDMSRFPSAKHFVSWLGLSPKHKQSGKMKRRVKQASSNNAGQIFRLSAQSLMTSKNNAIGAFMRKLRGRKGSRIAMKAGARKIAEAFYYAITKGMDYVERGAEAYLNKLKEREIYALKKLAQKHNFVLQNMVES